MPNSEYKELISHFKKLREWESANLPTYGTMAGQCLFLELASGDERKTLKEIYLSMPCAESTTRLLLRHLESDGWIRFARDAGDQRFREFQLTEKFRARVAEWLREVVACLSQAREACDHLRPDSETKPAT